MTANNANPALAPPAINFGMDHISSPASTDRRFAEARTSNSSQEDGSIDLLRMKAVRRIWEIVLRCGEDPCDETGGVMTPPLPTDFLRDELGCSDSVASELVMQLHNEGLIRREGTRFRILDLAQLRVHFGC